MSVYIPVSHSIVAVGLTSETAKIYHYSSKRKPILITWPYGTPVLINGVLTVKEHGDTLIKPSFEVPAFR
jgi:hypothetical protein